MKKRRTKTNIQLPAEELDSFAKYGVKSIIKGSKRYDLVTSQKPIK